MCEICGKEIVWGCNYDYNDLYEDEEYQGVVTQGHCPNCETIYETIMRVPNKIWNSMGEDI